MTPAVKYLLDPLEILLPQADLVGLRSSVAADAEMWAAQLLGGDDALAEQVAIRLMAVLYPGDNPVRPARHGWATPLGRVTARRAGHPSKQCVSFGVAGAMLGITRQGVHDLVSRNKLRGDGRPILLPHGAGGDMSAWETLAPQLNGRTLAVDLRGHGRSGDGPWERDAVLDDVESPRRPLRTPKPLGDRLGVTPFHGNSSGELRGPATRPGRAGRAERVHRALSSRSSARRARAGAALSCSSCRKWLSASMIPTIS